MKRMVGKEGSNVMHYLLRLGSSPLLFARQSRTGVRSMSSVIAVAARLWSRLFQHLTERNDRALAAWGTELQYKRRYTNPEDAVRARRMK
jgi:hypothetical protein